VKKNLASAVIAMTRRTSRQKLELLSKIDVASLIWRDCRRLLVCQNNYVISLRVAYTLGKLRRKKNIMHNPEESISVKRVISEIKFVDFVITTQSITIIRRCR